MKGWRTLAFSAGIGILGVAQSLDWTTVVGGQTGGMILIGIGAASAILRSITNTPVGNATPPAPKA